MCITKVYVHSFQRIGGIHNEFITGGGTDNKVGTYLCMKALLDSLENEDELKNDENVRVLVCCDSEEASLPAKLTLETVLSLKISEVLSQRCSL